jgi:hypothetical protein
MYRKAVFFYTEVDQADQPNLGQPWSCACEGFSVRLVKRVSLSSCAGTEALEEKSHRAAFFISSMGQIERIKI